MLINDHLQREIRQSYDKFDQNLDARAFDFYQIRQSVILRISEGVKNVSMFGRDKEVLCQGYFTVKKNCVAVHHIPLHGHEFFSFLLLVLH